MNLKLHMWVYYGGGNGEGQVDVNPLCVRTSCEWARCRCVRRARTSPGWRCAVFPAAPRCASQRRWWTRRWRARLRSTWTRPPASVAFALWNMSRSWSRKRYRPHPLDTQQTHAPVVSACACVACTSVYQSVKSNVSTSSNTTTTTSLACSVFCTSFSWIFSLQTTVYFLYFYG